MSKNRVSLTSDFLKAGDPSLCKCIRQVVICHYKLSDTLHKVSASQETSEFIPTTKDMNQEI
jgi:hypothetical protein